MKIQLNEIAIREASNGYLNSDEEGVVGYGGKLNIRPAKIAEIKNKASSVSETTQKEIDKMLKM